MSLPPTIILDTTGINELETGGPASEPLMKGLECGFEVILTAASADEIISTKTPEKREALLYRFGRLQYSAKSKSPLPIAAQRQLKSRPKDFRLTVVGAKGDTKLDPLDLTRVVQFPKTGKTFPTLVPRTLIYGRIGGFTGFFARDGKAKSSDRLRSTYSLVLAVPVENWQFDFTFPRKPL